MASAGWRTNLRKQGKAFGTSCTQRVTSSHPLSNSPDWRKLAQAANIGTDEFATCAIANQVESVTDSNISTQPVYFTKFLNADPKIK